uniref:Uncharacterized protein n=1 Tax=Anguilla anguilla TaxID=7936 RepID=A0A0E9R2C7_ANGAN
MTAEKKIVVQLWLPPLQLFIKFWLQNFLDIV